MMMDGLLNPGLSIRPHINREECIAVIERLYAVQCKNVRELNGYDDKNFKVETPEGKTFVFKILNSLDSQKLDFVDAQNELLLYLCKTGIKCPQPIQNKSGDYYSLEKLKSGEHVVRLMVFLPGKILSEATGSSKLFYEAGKYIANVDTKLQNFTHSAYTSHKSLWMLEATPQLRDFLFAVDDSEKRQLVENIIADFDNRVLVNISRLPAGIIHGDFNEQNILVNDTDIEGILDFGDSQHSCYVFELAIAMTYMIIVSKNVDAAAYVLAGYLKERSITDFEISLLVICIKARFCQSLVLGAYSSRQDPGNAYLLTTAKSGWKMLLELQNQPEINLLQHWKSLSENYAGEQ